MKITRHGSATRVAAAIGLVAGSWLALSAAMPAFQPHVPPQLAVQGAPDERIRIAQADVEPVERPVSYTNDQADSGEDRYERECEECHGDDLRGGMNGGAPLRGLAFEEKFMDGLPASGMYLYMSTLMPPNSPGRFSPETYADLMAYILKRNGVQPGSTPLPSDVDQLDYLIIE